MNYREAWDFLDQLQFFKIKLGLDSMNRFLSRLDNPHLNLPCIHIAGTNGKGSVGATLCSILTAAGYKTGFYTSPHLSSVRERFRINDSYISRDDFVRLMEKIRSVLGENQITYFECTTTLAMLWFAEQQVDCAILEVGMGGRLDATNVVTPLLGLITNVSMDHEQYLGTTLREVATEKAGIIKQNIPVVSGVADDASREVVVQRCREKDAPLFLYGRDFSGSPAADAPDCWNYSGLNKTHYTGLPLAMRGSYQVTNASLALAALQLLPDRFTVSEQQIRTGLEQTRWPGRLESFILPADPAAADSPKLQYLLDGAHNPAGVAALRKALQHDYSYKRLLLIWGAMADKDLHTTLDAIAPLADLLIFTRAESERSATAEELAAVLDRNSYTADIVRTDCVDDALAQAADRATPEDLICIAGSLYLVGAAREKLVGRLTDG